MGYAKTDDDAIASPIQDGMQRARIVGYKEALQVYDIAIKEGRDPKEVMDKYLTEYLEVAA